MDNTNIYANVQILIENYRFFFDTDSNKFSNMLFLYNDEDYEYDYNTYLLLFHGMRQLNIKHIETNITNIDYFNTIFADILKEVKNIKIIPGLSDYTEVPIYTLQISI